MNRRDAFDANLASWLDDAAAAAIPAGLRDGVMAGITEGSPLPAPVAGLGSHWLPTAPGLVELERWSIRLPVRRSSAAVLLLALLTIAFIGGAVLVGSRLPQHRSGAGRLAYGLDGDIYLADADGRDPVRVADGALTGPGPSFGLVGWAPDGSHLVYLESGADAAIAHITDVDGKATASFTLAAGAFYPGLQWSPDSTRLQGWDGGGTGFGIYGLDGRRQAFLPLPAGLGRSRETSALWAPDGRSLIAHLEQTSALNGASQTWDLPVDGSPPRRLADDDPRASSPFDVTRDGSRVAFVTAPTQVAPVSLYVANADGTDRRLLVNGSGSGLEACTPSDPRWSPDETRVLYDCYRDPDVQGLRIVDVASGTVHGLVDVLPASVTSLGWSPAGDQVLFVTLDTTAHGSLWTINSDGSRQTLLVDGASEGSWQWVQPGR